MYYIAVIGAGAAGLMAAIRAGRFGKKIILIERNSSTGKKILLTGKGRCNITNTASLDEFIEKFGRVGQFLRHAFSVFFNKDLMDFFKKEGLELVPERQGRVFPVDYKARSVVEVFKKALSDAGVEFMPKTRVKNIKKSGDSFELLLKDNKNIKAKKVILATGGISWRETGSTGDGFRIAKEFGHKLTPLKPALVPLRTKETWVKELQGLALKNVRLFISASRRTKDGKIRQRKIESKIGEMLFTHFGVSGPLLLDLSGEIVWILAECKEAKLLIDLKPALTGERIEEKLLTVFKSQGSAHVKNVLKSFLPQRLIPVFVRLAGARPDEEASQATKSVRQKMVNLFKEFPLTITGTLSISRAMVTQGGVSIKEIDSKTMESKLVPGLYFAGEIIEGAAPSGGYNLQQAFSTGYLAGESAAL